MRKQKTMYTQHLTLGSDDIHDKASDAVRRIFLNELGRSPGDLANPIRQKMCQIRLIQHYIGEMDLQGVERALRTIRELSEDPWVRPLLNQTGAAAATAAVRVG